LNYFLNWPKRGPPWWACKCIMLLEEIRQLRWIKGKANTAWPKENNVRHSQLLPTVRPLVAVVVALDVLWFLLVFLLVFWSFLGKASANGLLSHTASSPTPLASLSVSAVSWQAVGKRVKVLKPSSTVSAVFGMLVFKFDPASAKLLLPKVDCGQLLVQPEALDNLSTFKHHPQMHRILSLDFDYPVWREDVWGFRLRMWSKKISAARWTS